ncbi:hypothetical protein PPERSA_07013 [Pseudocohnilembus persalinus]|uniref:Uncharacterized protein n=1 Tax=Pseudocohnilembus persalinus TaxID=266149 RepID=A0A0V0QMA5_PSEPJ|nr:hypothetical protein PPERSA_07013 [Pseudocohnilembus persalinus]|eukprot:KRX03185.1 hypothetical protein PPERSA_07013 [Pseudocohnilembus persalinus]
MDKEVQDFSREIEQIMKNGDQQIYQELAKKEKSCLDYAKDNVDRFVNCMSDSTKKIEKEEKKFEYRMAFLQHNLYTCFQKAQQNSSSKEPCKQQARDNIQRYLDELVQSLRR